MNNPESVQANKTLKFVWYFAIRTHNLVSAKRPDLLIISKKEKKKKEKSEPAK